MTFDGYRLVGTAKTAPPGYIPSLIGIAPAQTEPASTDTYFEQMPLPPEALNLNAIAFTRWVSYDSLPLAERDPILAVKGGGIGFYMPLSELIAVVNEHGSTEARLLVASHSKKTRA